MRLRKTITVTTCLIATLAAVLYLLLLVGLWAMQDHILFARRTSEMVEEPSARDWPFEQVWVDAEGERTHGWWIPLEGARKVILFSHGSGRNISGYLEDVALFHELGFSVLLYDYGGYGLSSGFPSEARCYADARAMWDHLVQHRGIAPENIILAGSSLGGGVTMGLATQVSPGAIILESTFTSIPDSVAETFPFIPARWICTTRFSNKDKVGGLLCPVLVIHSRDDKTVPFHHAEALYERITAPSMLVEIKGAHYGGKFVHRGAYLQGLRTFFTDLVRIPVAGSDDNTP